MDSNAISRDQIRAAVREALREVLPQISDRPSKKTSAPSCLLMKKILGVLKSDRESLVELNVANDKQLNNFVVDFAKCLRDKDVEAMILSGRLRFKLRGSSSEHPQSSQITTSHSTTNQQKLKPVDERIERGMLSEAKIAKLAERSQRIVISKKVVLTPLAKDRARAMGIEIVRQ